MPKLFLAFTIPLILAGICVYACSSGSPIWSKSAKSDTALFRFVVGTDKDARAGYIDINGKVVIPPIFQSYGNDEVDDFFDGIALVRIADQEWYIDSKGNKLFRNRRSGVFSEGLTTFEQGAKVGYLNKQGLVSIPPLFDSADSFSEELAAVEVGDRYGYISRTGILVIKPAYVLALPFSNGIARVVKQGGCLYIGYGACDPFNPLVLPFQPGKYRHPTMHERPCAYSFIDKTGRELSPTTYRDAKDFAEGLAPVGDGSRWGFVNVNGSIAIPLQYQNAQPFSEGLAAVEMNGKWGYVNHSGAIAIPATYAAALGFSEGIGLILDASGQYQFIDKQGRQAIPGSFIVASSFAMGRAHVRTGIGYDTARWAYIDRSGRAIFRYTANGEIRP